MMNKRSTKQIAVGLLAHRDHSLYELKQKLQQRDCPSKEIEDVITLCLNYDWLNDTRFAEHLLRQGVAKGYGWQRICGMAKLRGIDIQLLKTAQKNQQHDWFLLARKVALQRFARYGDALPDVDFAQQQKWMRTLLNRGFTREQVIYALSNNDSSS